VSDRSNRPTYTVIISADAVDDDALFLAVCAAADTLARWLRPLSERWDVDVIAGTFADPLAGDNVYGLGGDAGSVADDTTPQPSGTGA
jgi:hypothetical protein